MLGKIRNGGGGGGALKKAVADLLTSLGVTTKASAKDAVVLNNINTLSDNKYESGYSTGQAAGYASGTTDGANSVTLTSTASDRTVTTTASNGKSSSLSIAYGTSSGNHTYTLTPTSNNTVTVTLAAGYYKAGTITADGSTAYSAGVESLSDPIKIALTGTVTGGSLSAVLLVYPTTGIVEITEQSGSYKQSGIASAGSCYNCSTGENDPKYANWSCSGTITLEAIVDTGEETGGDIENE